MIRLGIIGGGFSGTMCAVQLIRQSTEQIEILLFNERDTLNRGIAYTPYSDKHLLNVITSKMSAFPDEPEHFLHWVMQLTEYKDVDQTVIADSFLPRRIYGDYLCSIWDEALTMARSKQIKISIFNQEVIDLAINKNSALLQLKNRSQEQIDYCIISTGNHMPRNPKIPANSFYTSPLYFRNPWKVDAVSNLKNDLPVLIIGNGLTMVDTVLGLLEKGFKGEIYSVSPHGFNILPHRHTGLKYTALSNELGEQKSLLEIVTLVNKHIKTVREFGISAEPIIDSLRPHTQKIWQSLSIQDKRKFMGRLRHLWGVARHRIPLHTYDKIQQLRIDQKLHIISGQLYDMREKDGIVSVEYLDKKVNKIIQGTFARVINCTGPESDIARMEGHFLKQCLDKGILFQDELKLGICANTSSFEVKQPDGTTHDRIFTLGSTLRGELWESTAVNELREQAQRLASVLIKKS